MISVFEASTGLEAHMILNLLEQEGITGRVDGEYLQGGVGELQAMNFVRVLVDEKDYAEAGKIISKWESIQPAPDNTKAKSSRSGGFRFIFGLLIGAGIMYWAYETPVSIDGIDYNHDGVLDDRWTYRGDRISKAEVDRNLDGKVDQIEFYNRRGIMDHADADDNFDGIFETRFQYEQNSVAVQESDLNNDGEVDYRAYFEHGVLHQVVISGSGLNSPSRKQTYKMNKLVSADHDTNGDGIYDQHIEYDYFEDPANNTNQPSR